MVDGTKRPSLHHKEVAPVLVRMVCNGEVLIPFLGLHVLVKDGRRANVDGYMDILESTFLDHVELQRICVACATDCTNTMMTGEGEHSEYVGPKKMQKGEPARPPSQPTHKGKGGGGHLQRLVQQREYFLPYPLLGCCHRLTTSLKHVCSESTLFDEVDHFRQ